MELEKRLRTYDWNYEETDHFLSIEKKYSGTRATPDEVRRSIIQEVTLPRLEQFYIDLNAVLGTDLKTPYPHITLYTTSTRADRVFRGIGVYSKDELDALSPKQVEVGRA